MWMGRWSKELSVMYDCYYELFGVEPDCYGQIDYDGISYNDFKRCLKKSILTNIEFPESIKRTVKGFR